MGSERQRQAVAEFARVSRAVHDARWFAGEHGLDDGSYAEALDEALGALLHAETSCYLYWGEDWVPRAEAGLASSRAALARVGVSVETPRDAIPAATAETISASAPFVEPPTATDQLDTEPGARDTVPTDPSPDAPAEATSTRGDVNPSATQP
jgi:4-alpha-glucanotransferase